MSWNPFISGAARQASDMAKHVQKILNAQRDILSPQAVAAVESALTATREAISARADNDAMKRQMDSLEGAANKWLKPYPNAAIRENIEVLLVALSVAMAIRTFFAQPFKIPTGSMQPTLYGITPTQPRRVTNPASLQSRVQVDGDIPGPIGRLFQFWIRGNSYVNIVAPEDGEINEVMPPRKFLLFNLSQEYMFNGRPYTVWFPAEDTFVRAGYVLSDQAHGIGEVRNSPHFKAGDPIARLVITAGDHVFVDRVTYNFRRPDRGEIIVFKTAGILKIREQDQFYIKRMVAMGGEKLQIGNDRHLIIDGKRLDKTTPHFEKIYSFDPAQPPRSSQYSGHVNQFVVNEFWHDPVEAENVSPNFIDENTQHIVEPGHYFAMGDNTMDSADSRTWGDLPQENIIGKYFMVYWPFSSRFGWSAK